MCIVSHHGTASAVAATPSLKKYLADICSGKWFLKGTETEEMITTNAAYQNNFAKEGGVGEKNRLKKHHGSVAGSEMPVAIYRHGFLTHI